MLFLMTRRSPARVHDAHRHLGVLPAYPFYGGPPVNPDTTARATDRRAARRPRRRGHRAGAGPAELRRTRPGARRSRFNDLVIEAAQRDDRIRAGLWVSPRPQDAAAPRRRSPSRASTGCAALKLSFLLGGRPSDAACRPQLDADLRDRPRARPRRARAHLARRRVRHRRGRHAGRPLRRRRAAAPRAPRRRDERPHQAHRPPVLRLDRRRQARLHRHLLGHRLRARAGSPPRSSAAASAHDRVLFASDQPWGDFAGEHARLRAATGDGELAELVFPATSRPSTASDDPPSRRSPMTQTAPATTGTPLISDEELEANQQASLDEIPHPSLPAGTNIYGSHQDLPRLPGRGRARPTSPSSTASRTSRR